MAENCVYRFGEFSELEFFGEEFFIGFKDCSQPFETGINCKKVLIYPKPYVLTQKEIDYNLLWKYVEPKLLLIATEFSNKTSIGKFDKHLLYLSFQSKLLIEYLILFKEELKLNPTIDNYKTLFESYKLACIDKQWKCNYRLNKWLKDMMMLLNIDSLIGSSFLTAYIYEEGIPYLNNQSTDLDPILYIYNS